MLLSFTLILFNHFTFLEICEDHLIGCETFREQGLCKLQLIQLKCKSTCGICGKLLDTIFCYSFQNLYMCEFFV